jgi:hypothetical protein
MRPSTVVLAPAITVGGAPWRRGPTPRRGAVEPWTSLRNEIRSRRVHCRHDDVPGVTLNDAAVGDKRADEEVVLEKDACVQPPAGCEPRICFSSAMLRLASAAQRSLRRNILSALRRALEPTVCMFMLIAWFKKIYSVLPDGWHCHLRLRAAVCYATKAEFGWIPFLRALIVAVYSSNGGRVVSRHWSCAVAVYVGITIHEPANSCIQSRCTVDDHVDDGEGATY